MPDRQANLHLAEGHVERGRQIVADQEMLVAKTERAGGDPTEMRVLLEIFRDVLATFEEDLLRLRHAK